MRCPSASSSRAVSGSWSSSFVVSIIPIFLFTKHRVCSLIFSCSFLLSFFVSSYMSSLLLTILLLLVVIEVDGSFCSKLSWVWWVAALLIAFAETLAQAKI